MDVDHSKTTLDKNPKIMILDLDTGVDMKESQWNEALHQFLQLKHGCRLSLMSLKAVFISNISFFNKYSRVFGLSGTMGTDSDRDFLKKTYKVDFLSMPLALPKKFIEEEPIICKDLSCWKKDIFQDTSEALEANRSVLIICGTVLEAEMLHEFFKAKKTTYEIELYRRDYEPFKVTEEGKCLEPGHVIIATNLAGRGTDIKLSPELKKNKGLHVILSYLPDNLRVEQQAFGRASRCGDSGTGRLIFIDTISVDGTDCDAINLKILRDDLEISRVSDILSYYNSVILKEEKMFEFLQETYQKLKSALEKAYQHIKDYKDSGRTTSDKKMLTGSINEVKELVTCSLLDDWAFWIDRYSIILAAKQNPDKVSIIDKGIHKFDTDEDRLIRDFQRLAGRYEEVSSKYTDPNWLEKTWNWCTRTVGVQNTAEIEDYALSLVHEPALLVKAAKCFISRKKCKTAIYYLNKVTKAEPDHNLIALYYNVLCRLKLQEWNTNSFRESIEQLREKLDTYRLAQASYASAVSEICFVDTQKLLHCDGYRKQKENVMRLIGMYRNSIDNMAGRERIFPGDFASFCDESVAAHLCTYLEETGALSPSVFSFVDDKEKIKTLADDFCMSSDQVECVLKEFSGRYFKPEVEKEFSKKLDLPSRTDFWEQIKSCVDNIEEFCVIQSWKNAANTNPPSSENTATCEHNAFITWADPKRPYVSKFGSDMSSTTKNQFVYKCTLRNIQDLPSNHKHRYLRKAGRLCHEEVGYLNIEKLRAFKLQKYHKIQTNTFAIIEEVSKGDSQKIFKILQNSRIIDEHGVLLSTEWTKDKLKLTLAFEAYRADVLAILQSKCKYQYEILSLLHQFDQPAESSGESEKKNESEPRELKIRLSPDPTKEFVMSAMESGFIKGLLPKPSYFDAGGVGSFFEKVFREPVSWAKWIGKKTGISGGPAKSYLYKDDLKKLLEKEPENKIQELYADLCSKKWIKDDGEIILEMKDNLLTPLKSEFDFWQNDVLSLAQWKQHKIKEKFLQETLGLVYESQGKLKTLDSPDGDMVDLDKKLEGVSDKGELVEEVTMFTLSGFDHVIDTVEERYTWKMIFSALAVIIIGVAQCALGIFLEFVTVGFGTFIAAGLIQEGIGDIIYGIMAFRSGHFSWQDWVDNKWRSIAITAATMCIGALIAKGIKFSKYGQKLFGSWGSKMGGRAIQESLKETGKAGIKISIANVLLKSLGYKVLQGCAIAASSMAVSYAYDTALKRFIDHVSSEIFNNSAKTIEQHKVTETLGTLVDKVGVAEAQVIVGRCVNQVMSRSACEVEAQQYMAQMLGPVINGLKAASAKMNRAGTFSSQESTLVMMLLQLASHLMTTVAVLDALKKMSQSITRHLNEVEKEISMEMNKVQTKTQVAASPREKSDFIYNFKEKTNAQMKEKIGSVMRHTLIEPLMTIGCEKLLTVVGRRIRSKIVERREAGIQDKINKIKIELDQDPDAPAERRQELHKQVLQLCAKSRDPNVIAHAIKCGGPLGIESLQVLANMLGVTIIVESDNPNIPKKFEPQNGSTRGTLTIKHKVTSDEPGDVGHWSSGDSYGTSGSSGYSADCLLDAVNKEMKAKFPNIGPIGREDLANAMRQDPSFKEFIKNGWHHSYYSVGGFGGAEFLKKEQVEVTGSFKEDVLDNINQLEQNLNEQNRMVQAVPKPYTDPRGGRPEQVDNPGPIKEYSLETINGKEELLFQKGVVTPETISNKQSRDRPDVIESTKEGACRTPRCQVAGHASPICWGAPTTNENMFLQGGHENNTVNKQIELSVLNFVKSNKANNPSVEYKRVFHRDAQNPRVSWHTFVLDFKLNGEPVPGYQTRVYIVPNEPCACPRREHRAHG